MELIAASEVKTEAWGVVNTRSQLVFTGHRLSLQRIFYKIVISYKKIKQFLLALCYVKKIVGVS